MTLRSLAIIGTAGRKEDKDLLAYPHYNRMLQACTALIPFAKLDPQELCLVSGGAAWSDHLVVTLTLLKTIPFERLTLYLPATLTSSGYVGTDEWTNKVASTANYYHNSFSYHTGWDSIAQLNEVRDKGANLIAITGGFHARNAQVAKAVSPDGALLAFTTGGISNQQPPWTARPFPPDTKADDAGLKDGGTADTWNKAYCAKYHARIGPMDPDPQVI